MLDGRRLTDHFACATPANGKDGHDVVNLASLEDPKLVRPTFPKGWKDLRPCLRLTPQPSRARHEDVEGAGSPASRCAEEPSASRPASRGMQRSPTRSGASGGQRAVSGQPQSSAARASVVASAAARIRQNSPAKVRLASVGPSRARVANGRTHISTTPPITAAAPLPSKTPLAGPNCTYSSGRSS